MPDRDAAERANDDHLLIAWIAALEARHLADLRFAEVSRALRALSADYVQRRSRVRESALSGRGKRAAFALFYGPLHFIVVDRAARALGLARQQVQQVIDLGCGTGASGTAVACVTGARSIDGVDRHAWAVEEARWTYRHFNLHARVLRGDAARVLSAPHVFRPGPDRRGRSLLIAAYTVNELAEGERAALLPLLIGRASRGSGLLVVEPIARGITPWWGVWTAAFERAGGHAAEWRFAVPLPAPVRALGLAAGLDHREQTARTLFLPPSPDEQKPEV